MIVKKIEENIYSFEEFTEDDLDWKNFSGEKRGKFAPAHPNFDIYIPEELANELRDEGVRVKLTEPRDQGDQVKYRVNIKVNMDYYVTPEVYIRNGSDKEYLTEDSLYILDRKTITYGEMIAKLNHNQQTEGVAALYANVLGVKVLANPFDAKWAEEESPEDDGLPFR